MATSVRNFRTLTVCVPDLSLQRVKERKTYLDQDIDDDDIEGKRSYNLDEKLASTKHNKDYVTTGLRGEGKGYLAFKHILLQLDKIQILTLKAPRKKCI